MSDDHIDVYVDADGEGLTPSHMGAIEPDDDSPVKDEATADRFEDPGL